MRNRVAAYRTRHGGNALEGVRFVTDPLDLLSGDPADLADAIKGAGLARPTVFIDTLNRAAPGADENSSVDMGRIIAACKRLQAEAGGLVVLVHHTGKDAAKGLRGHSSLFAALDAAIQVSRDGDRREWALAKAKDGADGEAHGFTLGVVDLGEDEDGDRVTSCVVEPTGAEGADTRQPLGKNAARALEVLRDLHQQHASNLAESGADPAKALVSFSDWCAAMQDALPKNRASEARGEILKKGYAVATDGYVRMVPVVPVGSEMVPNGTTGTAVLVPFRSTPPLGGGTGTGTGTPGEFGMGWGVAPMVPEAITEEF